MTLTADEARAVQIHLLAKRTAASLEKRNISAHIAKNRKEALELAESLVQCGATLARGGSKTVDDLGVIEHLEKTRAVKVLRASEFESARAHMLASFGADVYLASANAISSDGVIINIDGNSNRVAAIAQGPLQVILFVGINKVAADFESALARARNIAAPTNACRFETSTPCTKTGICADCKSPETVCCQFLITRYSRHTGRIHVILLEEEAGF